MTVTILGLHPDSGDGSISKEATSASVKYRALASSYADNEFNAIFALAPITIGSPYVYGSIGNLNLRVSNISAERDGSNSLIWNITVDYETSKTEETEDWENPLNEPPVIKWGGQDKEVPVDKVVSGSSRVATDGFKNSAGEPFNPPPTKRANVGTLSITRNEPVSNSIVEIANTYRNAVNSDTFWGFPAGYVQCVNISVENKFKNTPSGSRFFYLSVTAEFIVDPEGFDIQPLDIGSYYLILLEDENIRVAFKTDDGEPYQGLLNGEGGKLPHGDPAVYLAAKQIYPKLPFSALSLPQSF